MAGLGLLFVGIAAIGVILPGVPTAGPLIIASIFLTKSSPSLERRLIRNRFFARYLVYLDGSREMPLRAKVMAIVLMWASIGVSSFVLHVSSGGPIWLLILLFLAGLTGTGFIIRYGRNHPVATESSDQHPLRSNFSQVSLAPRVIRKPSRRGHSLALRACNYLSRLRAEALLTRPLTRILHGLLEGIDTERVGILKAPF